MSDEQTTVPPIPVDDFVLPFQLESSHIRGRDVRLGPALDAILKAHKYPDTVNRLLAEAIVLCTLLSSMLKYEGIFTLQTKGDGPVSMLICDATSDGDIRGCATFDKDAVMAYEGTQPFALLGAGYLAFTVDQGPDTERYQGIVELKGPNLITSIQHYFTQSEQIGTGILTSVGAPDGQWRGRGLMLQHMPEDAKLYNLGESGVQEDDWRRAMILMGSVKDEEMLDPTLPSPDLLFRLFHEEGVRIYDARPLQKNCRCSVAKIENIIAMMSEDDLEDMADDGEITMTCEFCSREYAFDITELKGKIKEKTQ